MWNLWHRSRRASAPSCVWACLATLVCVWPTLRSWCRSMLPFRAGRALRTDSATNKVILGIPRDPLDVLTEACKLVHPVERSDVINLAVAVAIQNLVSYRRLSCWSVGRAFSVEHYPSICWLNEQEASLHANTPPHLGKVMKGKRILLLDALLRESGHPDKLLCAHLEKGFPLVWQAANIKHFCWAVVPPSIAPRWTAPCCPEAKPVEF